MKRIQILFPFLLFCLFLLLLLPFPSKVHATKPGMDFSEFKFDVFMSQHFLKKIFSFNVSFDFFMLKLEYDSESQNFYVIMLLKLSNVTDFMNYYIYS